MEQSISKSKFKAHALEIFRQVESTGEPVIVTDHGSPRLIVRKFTGHKVNPQERLKGSVLHYHAPLDPVGAEDWDALA